MKTIPLEEALPCRVLALLVLVLFYGIYFGKAMVQKRKGIQTRQIGRRKEKNIHTVELLMSAATLLAPAAQLLSLVLGWSCFPANARFTGFLLGLLGDGIFLTSVLTMRDSWRAGIPDRDKTELITSGIYAYSRNPAFLGFDLMYLGTFLLLGNWLTGLCSAFAILTLHLQILQEERFRRPPSASPTAATAPKPPATWAENKLRPGAQRSARARPPSFVPPPQRPSRRQCRSAASRTAGTPDSSRQPTGDPRPPSHRPGQGPGRGRSPFLVSAAVGGGKKQNHFSSRRVRDEKSLSRSDV